MVPPVHDAEPTYRDASVCGVASCSLAITGYNIAINTQPSMFVDNQGTQRRPGRYSMGA